MAKKKRPKLTELELDIYKLIKRHTLSHPVYSREIERMYRISGWEVRNLVGRMRDEGEPVGSTDSGYYFARNQKELEPSIRHLKSRALKMLNRARRMESSFNPKPVSLFEEVA
jgi:hypothetical protein